MPFFAYTGRDASGSLVKGVVEGADSNGAAGQLFAQGVTPLSISPTSAPGGSGDAGALSGLFAPQVSTVELMLFSRQFHTLLKAGVPILAALAGLEDSSPNPAMRQVISGLREDLDAGRDLSTAMRRRGGVFSEFYVAMVRVGELTGRLEDVFMQLYHHLEFEKFMREQVRSALRYPGFVVIAMLVAIGVINMMVVPAFARVFAQFGGELPLMTRILIASSEFTLAWWPAILAGGAGLVFLSRRWVATESGRYQWDRLKLRLPIAGKIVLKATLARFARSFALAGKSGVPIVQGLATVATTVENAYLSECIKRMQLGVERGESVLRTATATGVFTPVVLQMIAVGEETGAIEDLMDEVGGMYQQEVEYELKTLGQQIEPILIVFLGVLVLILALGVFLPMWDLGRVANRPG